ncbi:hypothetical protein FKM82_019809 [Ascaphus truei]
MFVFFPVTLQLPGTGTVKAAVPVLIFCDPLDKAALSKPLTFSRPPASCRNPPYKEAALYLPSNYSQNKARNNEPKTQSLYKQNLY